MNQRQRIVKAISLVRPVANAVKDRRPKGFPNVAADVVAGLLQDVDAKLEQACSYYDRYQGAEESKP